jgi:hypothetical protein
MNGRKPELRVAQEGSHLDLENGSPETIVLYVGKHPRRENASTGTIRTKNKTNAKRMAFGKQTAPPSGSAESQVRFQISAFP